MWWSSGSDRKWWSQRTSFESKRRCREHCRRCGGRLLAAFSAKEAENKKAVDDRAISEENITDCIRTLALKDESYCKWDCQQVKFGKKFDDFLLNKQTSKQLEAICQFWKFCCNFSSKQHHVFSELSTRRCLITQETFPHYMTEGTAGCKGQYDLRSR